MGCIAVLGTSSVDRRMMMLEEINGFRATENQSLMTQGVKQQVQVFGVPAMGGYRVNSRTSSLVV